MILRFNDLIISRKLQLSRNEMQLRRPVLNHQSV